MEQNQALPVETGEKRISSTLDSVRNMRMLRLSCLITDIDIMTVKMELGSQETRLKKEVD